jgi:hypothetical protein
MSVEKPLKGFASIGLPRDPHLILDLESSNARLYLACILGGWKFAEECLVSLETILPPGSVEA